MTEFVIPYTPQPRQLLLHSSVARQIFYGGAAGGGKSVAIRWDLILLCLQNPGCQAYLFRRTLPELRKTHINPLRAVFPDQLGLGKWSEEQKTFNFINGSALSMCYCESEDDVKRYLSEEMHVVGIDEASTFTPTQIAFLKTRNRLGSWAPTQDKNRLPRFVMGSNPGGPSHGMLKRTFIDVAIPETIFHDQDMRDPDNPNDLGWSSVYIPAKMTDNKYIDSDYRSSFGGLSPELAKAYRDGDWDVVVGQCLPELSRDRHCLRAFTIPKHWTRFTVIDWGTAKPFSIGFYSVSDGAILKSRGNYPERWIPAGALVRYDEIYGWNGKENQGCRFSAERVATELQARERQLGNPDYRIADGEMWAMRGGPSVISYFEERGLIFRRAIKDRMRNYQEIVCRLVGNERYYDNNKSEVDPMLFITENCKHFWRTVPSLTFDETNPEKGPDTKQEDHTYDDVAYACRSRPYVSTEEDRIDEEEDEIKAAMRQGNDPYATV